ncbi:MAG TPA: hypothetical protein PKH94_03305 [Bacteroidales bacterium]|nr:hypothetical protein [Bacteroidales bacterium]HNS46242.1 hypothetical protein [Bacteroidales bacterium]
MKHSLIMIIPFLVASCTNNPSVTVTTVGNARDTADLTNDFYDNEPVHELTKGELMVDGEVYRPGNVDLGSLPLHSVIVKETILSGDSNRFVGAYRYDGYSLFDILNQFVPDKVNKEEFPPIIDLYVEITNKEGEKAVFSWGEIYYPVNRHQIILATKVMEIVPSKTKDHWPLPGSWKIVAVPDLITERNLSDPVAITVKSLGKSFPVDRDKKYTDAVSIFRNDSLLSSFTILPTNCQFITYPTIFYGRGRGIHSVTPFQGVMLKDLLAQYIHSATGALRNGLVTVKGADGYRSAFTLSEIINRNDQSEVIIVDVGEGEEGGRFRLFPSADFFSDRAVFSLEEIRADF